MGSWYVFYFMFVVFFGSFYLINLVLAVVAVSYQQEVVSMQERVRCYVMINSLRTLTPTVHQTNSVRVLCAVSVTEPPLPLPSGTGRQGIRTGWRAVMICSGGPTLSSVLNAATKNYDIPF